MRFRFCAFALVLLAARTTVADAPDITAENVGAFLDATFSVQQQDHPMVGAVVSVVYKGDVLATRGYGYANLETRTPADPERSLFGIGSISKPFVWTAMMQLSERGLVDLNAEVSRYIDFDIPDTFDKPIRVWHLMSHTAGFEEQALGARVPDAASVPKLRDYLVANMPMRVRTPGEHLAYSSYGTTLAGYIIERVGGQAWADFVGENILAPLGMTSTNALAVMPRELRARHAIGYKFRGGRYEPEDYWHIKDTPAGVMSSTATDMAAFMIAHLSNGKYRDVAILEEATVQRMKSPLFNPHDNVPPFLHGFYRSDRNGQIVYGHDGDIGAFHSSMKLLPEHDLGLFIAINSDPGSTTRSNLAASFLDHFFEPEFLPEPPHAVELNLAEYVGEYVPLRSNRSTVERLAILVNGRSIAVSEGDLILRGGGQTSRWIPTATDRFSERRGNRRTVFERDESGAISHLVVGSLFGTMQRVSGLDAPSNARLLLVSMVGIALFSVFGYGYRGFVRAEKGKRLPKLDVALGWLFSLLLAGLWIHLGATLGGDLGKFAMGIPLATQVNLLLMNANSVLGIAVMALAIRQWASSAGAVAPRIRYSLLALAAIISLWMSYYFNVLAYLFD